MFLPGPGRKGFAPSIGKIAVTDHILVAAARSPESVPLVPGAFVGPPGARLDVACRRPSEREVLALVVNGLTNRQIAQRLTISEKTAEGHVGNILAKLSCSSRIKAAELARATGLLEGSAA